MKKIVNGKTEDAETSLKYDFTIERLYAGEKVECKNCHKGYYRPFNSDAKINHSYTCDNCGEHINIDPVVLVE